jgi:hypothetical protein
VPIERYNDLKKLLDESPGTHEGHILNTFPSVPSPLDYLYPKVAGFDPVTVEAPVAIDYRPVLPPCFDQGQRGCCTAEGGVGAKSYQEIKQGDYPINGLSVAFLYTSTKLMEGNTTEGAMPKTVMQVLQKTGVCTEDTMPFHLLGDLPTDQLPAIPSGANAEAAKFKINTYAQLCGGADVDRSLTLSAMRIALKNEGVFTLAFLVCSNFTPDANGFLPLPAGTVRGGHQISIAGDLPDLACPDGTKGALILRNSWGTSWGINGYAYLPYSWLMASYDPWGNGQYKAYYVFESWTATDIIVTPMLSRAKNIVITIGANTMVVDGVVKSLDQPAYIDPKTDRTLLPVRAIAESAGYKVVWDASKPDIVTLVSNS